jgi:hypothetical protein
MNTKSVFGIIFLLCLLQWELMAQNGHDSTAIHSKLNVSGTFVSRYIDRGRDVGASPAIQPEIAWKWKNWEMGSKGSFQTNSPGYNELDLYISYTLFRNFTFTIIDYFYPCDTIMKCEYFNYSANFTHHVMEANVKIGNFKKIPFSFLAAVNFFGNDARQISDDPSSDKFNKAEALKYSTYLELIYSGTCGKSRYEVFIGGTTNEVKKSRLISRIPRRIYVGEDGYYGDGPGIINCGVRAMQDIQITETFALPLFVELIANPQDENLFLILGLTLKQGIL